MADTQAANNIFMMTTLNDELIGSLDWVSDKDWTRKPADGEWSAAEIVGHVIELELYWAREVSRLAQQPGSPVGRDLDAPSRLAGPDSGLTLSAKEARTRIAQSGEQAAELLRRIPDSAWSTGGKWRGEDTTIAQVVQRNIIDHLREHLDQVTTALASSDVRQ